MKTLTVQQRSDALRERVRDAVTLLGHGDEDYGLYQFSRRCVSIAEVRGLRMWKSREGKPEHELALNSMQNLLQIRNGGTGRSEHWVLDIFEAGLDDIYRGKTNSRRPPDPADDQLGDDEVGVQPFAEERKPLGMRVLEAYIARDDDVILELVDEITRRMP